MRHRSTKERRKDREEFVYKFRREIKALREMDPGPTKKEAARLFVEQHARRELDYKWNTNAVDIWFFLNNTYHALFGGNIW